MQVDPGRVLERAKGIARRAGDHLRAVLDREMEIRHKGVVDLVTEADMESEELIISSLKREIGDIPIYAEEEGRIGGNEETGYIWFIDPLDGTTNYAHRYPHFCVSMALACRKALLLGVIYDPIRGELFEGLRGEGARLNGRGIRVSRVDEMDRALLATGFPYDRRERGDFYLRFFREFMLKSQGIRRDGAAALNLAYTACGRFDGFWEFGLMAWDMAAGSLILEESGGVVTGMDGEPLDPFGKRIVAGNPIIHEKMLALIKENLNRMKETL